MAAEDAQWGTLCSLGCRTGKMGAHAREGLQKMTEMIDPFG
jgi:hypothetical protein